MKSTIIKIVVLLCIMAAGHVGFNLLTSSDVATVVMTDAAVSAVNGGDEEFEKYKLLAHTQEIAVHVWDAACVIMIFFAFWLDRKKFNLGDATKVVPLN